MMKQLKFNHKYVTDILAGRRNATIRIDDKNIGVGDRLQLVDKTSNDRPQEWWIPGEIIVDGVQEFRLAKLPLEIAVQAEIDRQSKEELYTFLKRFYGNTIGENTVVKLITFTFQPYERPRPYMIKQSLELGVSPDRVKLYADGGSRGNPGPSASGFVIINDLDEVIESWNKYIGVTTNNQAEYHALLAGLEWCKQHNVQEVDVYLDSLLAINQMKGVYKVKNRDLWTLYETAKKLQGVFKKVTFTHVPRELNKLADAEVNKALDAVNGEDLLQ